MHPPHSSVTGVRGRGEGGVYTTSNAREKGRGREDARGQQKAEPYHLGRKTFTPVGLVGREQTRA